jgi:hypothetical protein
MLLSAVSIDFRFVSFMGQLAVFVCRPQVLALDITARRGSKQAENTGFYKPFNFDNSEFFVCHFFSFLACAVALAA